MDDDITMTYQVISTTDCYDHKITSFPFHTVYLSYLISGEVYNLSMFLTTLEAQMFFGATGIRASGPK